ncbi:NUDIX domain-containing protein [Planococcus sp. N028]|uniref:NUDIX domain-containing protein n=1 Tax=Planococcus shixiaomingii TaxID=3058393 RepID=A0ABT8N691_9BACL|nr:NUDIX domain-containing protein [Planococcus sp. N028]MDN7243065.1 NUDIX domain-containing protein [Planococcus sp. N028]
MEKEKIGICDEKGVSLGIAPREEVHKRGYWHETFHCWIVSKKAGKDTIHLQLRSKEKKDFPDLLDITAAGHLLAGETIEDGIREIEEELGVAVSFEELIPLGVIKDQIHQTDLLDNERCHVFLYKATENIDARYELQKEEVAGIVTVDFQRFYDLCQRLEMEILVKGFSITENGQKTAISKSISLKDLVPHSPAYLKQVADRIQQALSQ